MFKKIEIWILYIFLLLGIPVTIGFGILVRQELVGQIKFGRVSKAALFLADMPANIKHALKDDLVIKGNRFPNLNGFSGDPNLSESYLLLSRYDGNLREGIVELVDLKNFSVLHTWNPEIDKFNKLVNKVDEFKYLTRDHQDSRQLIKHPKLTRDGSLLFNSSPLRKIDACSNLVFQITHDIFHHSIETDKEGNIWVPSHMFVNSIANKNVDVKSVADGGYYADGIVKVSNQGEILYEKSISEIFIENGLEYLLYVNPTNDPIHLNDIQPVDFNGEFWKKGDLFLSLRNQSMIILYRPSTNKIIWRGSGPFFEQHDVDILDNHRISIFNNNIKRGYIDGVNEVIIYDFKKDKFTKYLKNSFISNQIITGSNGLHQILPNGDLFVEETIFGRTIYFNSDGTLRWTHLNRSKDGNVFRVSWSRILYSKDDLLTVKNFLKNKSNCDD